MSEEDAGVAALRRAARNLTDPTPMDLVAAAGVNPSEYLTAAEAIVEGEGGGSDSGATSGAWTGEEWTTDGWVRADPNTRAWAPALTESDQFMTTKQGEKFAFAPWGDPDHPAGRPEKDARYKWSVPDMWGTFEQARELAEVDPELDDALMFVLQKEDDPYRAPADRLILTDGDDVIDDQGRAHPGFIAVLNELFPDGTHASLSSSESGAHALGEGALPDGTTQLKIPLERDVEGFSTDHLDDDERPHIDIFDGNHLTKETGKHVLGTPEDVSPIDAETLDEYAEKYGSSLPSERGTSAGGTNTAGGDGIVDPEDVEYTGPDPAEWGVDPSDRDAFGYRAVLEAHYHGHAAVNFWRLTGAAAAFGVALKKSESDVLADLRGDGFPDRTESDSVGFGGKTPGRVEYDHERARTGEFSPPSLRQLARWGVLPAHFAERSESGSRAGPETCVPPTVDPRPFDREARREAMAGERYDTFIGVTGPSIWGDHAGVGKTTTAAIAAAERDRPHTFLFQNHRKAREFVRDGPTPDDYFHLKGAEQMLEEHCMDADHDGEQCPAHVDDCPHMCPVYDLDKTDSTRERYEAVAGELGPQRAHTLLGGDLPGHDEDGVCPWLSQFEEAKNADRIVGVHEYQLLKTVRDGRDVIVDETPGALRDERRLTVENLCKAHAALGSVASLPGAPDALGEFARFANDLVGALTDADAPDDLADIAPPSIDAETIHREVDPNDLPDDVDPDEVEAEYTYEDVGMPEEGHRKRLRHYVERDLVAETLAQAKYEYHETLVARMRDDEWDGEPLAFDALLAAAMEAGLDAEACRKAAALPLTLDSCPWCGHDLGVNGGGRVCSNDGCDWHEEQNHFTRRDGELARTQARIDLDPDDPCDSRALVHESLPLVSDLPADPLILDATATPSKVAPLYGVDRGEVDVQGDEPLAVPNLHTTQVLDGQYHAGTIEDSLDAGGSAAERIQRTIETVGSVHERPLFVVKKGLKPRFDFPENGEVEHYHALRGLNYNDCDAVVCIGAPHPRIDDLRREARLLAQGRDDVRVGGEEHSTRRDAPNPPVYRKLLYEDENGDGVAVPTKHYSGLVGDLFRETREKELVQAVHRIRPLLADEGETKHAHLLTNVPTDIPIDEVCEFETLADPIEALLPVPDGALDLLEAVRDVGAGAGPDGFRAEALVEREGDEATVRFDVGELHRLARVAGVTTAREGIPCEQTVRRWKDALADLGLLDAGAYEQRRGVVYTADASTLTSALSVVTNNGGVKVAVRRRFRRMTAKADGSLAWLRWARDALGLAGDRCDTGPPGGTPT